MNIVIDMNLSPDWEAAFGKAAHVAIHWSRIGAPDATDEEILGWAKANGHIVFTHDLDFGAILATSGAASPSVLQVRTQDVTPGHLERLVLAAVEQFGDALAGGALVSIDEAKSLARILPLR